MNEPGGVMAVPQEAPATENEPGFDQVLAQLRSIEPDDAGTIVLPDGRHMTPAGSDWVFDEDDLEGGLTTYLGAVTGNLVVTVDDGPVDHAVRVIDATRERGRSQNGQAGRPCRVERTHFVAGQRESLCGGADEDQSVLGAGLRQIRGLREEPVSRVERVDSRRQLAQRWVL